jgi:hypothetical protein
MISISAGLQEIIHQILSHVQPVLVHNLCEFDDLLGFSFFFRAAAALIDIMQETCLEILYRPCMGIRSAAHGAVADHWHKLATLGALMDKYLHHVFISVYSGKFEFGFLFFWFFQGITLLKSLLK